MRKSQALLPLNNARLDNLMGGGEAGSESYSSNSSFTDSYTDSSDLANWEEYVAEDGTLFYAEYMPNLRKSGAAAGGGGVQDKRIEFARNSSLRMGKKTARRQQQQQDKTNSQHQQQKQQNQQSTQQQQKDEDIIKFSHIKKAPTTSLLSLPTAAAAAATISSTLHDNFKQLELVITSADRFRFGRRSTAVESILGFRVIPYPDQPECLMVDGFVHDMPTMQQQHGQQISRGDWFKSLDDIEIRTSNVDELLLQFIEPTKVCLKFQGPAIVENNGNENDATDGASGHLSNNLHKINDFAMLAEQFEKLLMPVLTSVDANIPLLDEAFPFGLLILPPECYQSDQHRDSLYYYPENAETNFLYKARGSFLTLNTVLTAELNTKPMTSKLSVGDIEYFVNYRTLNSFLVLIAFSAKNHTLSESNLRADEIINYMQFAFPTLNLENFANSNESSGALRKFLHNFCEVQRIRLLAAKKKHICQFEELLKESRSLPLPKEAQLRIFDALSEMEAMDYRNWNDEPLNTHREFFIHGSALYYDNFLLASQMPVEVRANVEGFLRCRGIFDFITEQCVKELYVWEEIVMPNATGRYFLSICSRSHLLLAVILKIFDAPDLPTSTTISPSLFYIEEIQETLTHLIQCGIESLAMFWSVSNKRPEVSDKLEPLEDNTNEKDASKLETFIKQKLISASASASAPSSSQTLRRSISYDEDAHLCSSLGGSSIHSLAASDDNDASKKRSAASNADDSDSGGSDWENFAQQNPPHLNLDPEAQTQMTESLWKEIKNVVPVKISAGWKNAVFYYVYVDNANGSVFCPLKANSETFPFITEMRRACHIIHNVLQDTKNFRRLLAEENITPASSKGMLAIKEYGITMQVRDTSEKSADGNAAIKGRFCVIGRLFNMPTKEVYVCHHPDVPQNMVEMAFRLSFFSVG